MLLWLTKNWNLLTLNRSKYAGILASNPPSFFEDVYRPPGHEKIELKMQFYLTGENVAALAGKKVSEICLP